MKKITLAAAAVLTALFFASCSPSKESTGAADLYAPPKALKSQFTMLSVSARHALNDKSDVKKFADWIKSSGAELVAVQQVLRATDSKPGFDSYSELLKRLDMRGTFAKARYYKGWDSGNALFCLYPMLQSNTYTLPTGKGKIRRSLSFGVFELGLKPMAFASTDLDEDDLSERVKQVYEILSIQQSVKEYPMIVAGDFGEPVTGKAPLKMKDQYSCVNDDSSETAAMVQHIYFPNDGKVKVLSTKKIDYPGFPTSGILTTIEVTQ